MWGKTAESKTSDANVVRVGDAEREPETRTEKPVEKSITFRLGRLLFGGILAFMALDNLRNLGAMEQYAEGAGAPKPELSVPAISALLLGGGIGVTLWKYPRLAAASVAAFFVSVTPLMHDFWNKEGEERQQQQIHFFKNVALFGAALALLRFAGSRR